MGAIKITFRVLKWLAAFYGVWMCYRRSRWLRLVIQVGRLFIRKKKLHIIRKPEFIMISGRDSRIYKRRGWRKYHSRS